VVPAVLLAHRVLPLKLARGRVRAPAPQGGVAEVAREHGGGRDKEVAHVAVADEGEVGNPVQPQTLAQGDAAHGALRASTGGRELRDTVPQILEGARRREVHVHVLLAVAAVCRRLCAPVARPTRRRAERAGGEQQQQQEITGGVGVRV